MGNGFTKKELEIIGTVLYGCEGTRLRRDKRRVNNVYHWVIEFTNTDPRLIKLFLLFMRKVLTIHEKKLKGQLFIYNDLDQDKVEEVVELKKEAVERTEEPAPAPEKPVKEKAKEKDTKKEKTK